MNKIKKNVMKQMMVILISEQRTLQRVFKNEGMLKSEVLMELLLRGLRHYFPR